jgi:replicative DNA helicase
MDTLDRLPPQDLEAERAVLGSVILKPSVLDDVAEVLKPEDFYQDANQRLYSELVRLCEFGKKLDAALLADHLRVAGQWEPIGGAAYLGEVMMSAPVADNAVHYAQIVARKAAYRRIIGIATEMLGRAYDETAPPENIMEGAESRLAKGGHDGRSDGPKPFRDVLCEVFAQIDESLEQDGKTGLFTGITEFDEKLGGLFPGELNILAARPGVGKTALATQIACYCAQRKRLVYFASLEMGRSQIATRLLCSYAGVSSQFVRSGRLTPEQRERLVETGNRLGPASLFLDDRARLTTAQIRRASRRLVRQGLALVVVDYLQLITPTDRQVNREAQVSRMAWDLKTLSRELEVPVLCVAQLNREAAKGGRPGLHQLRESGAIEQHADTVMFIDPDANEPTRVEWRIAKNRYGPTADVALRWIPQATRFETEMFS